MGMALVDLHWTGAEFWAATPHELYAACEEGARRTKEGQQAEREAEFAAWRERTFGT